MLGHMSVCKVKLIFQNGQKCVLQYSILHSWLGHSLKFKSAWKLSVLSVVHKQMYWIRTNLRMFIFHYIMEYFGNLSSPCPLHEQPKDEIIFLGTAKCNYMCA